MLKVDRSSDYLAWLIDPKPSLLGFCSEFSQIQRSKPDLLFSEFSGFYILFNLQLSRFLFRCQTCLLQRLFIITGCFSFVNNFFNLFFCFFRNICCSLKREDYNSKSQTVCQQLFLFFQCFFIFRSSNNSNNIESALKSQGASCTRSSKSSMLLPACSKTGFWHFPDSSGFSACRCS